MPDTLVTNPPRFAELQRVTLVRPVSSDGGTLPAGAHGTVMLAHRTSAAYEVEFTDPFPTVVTVAAEAMVSATA